MLASIEWVPVLLGRREQTICRVARGNEAHNWEMREGGGPGEGLPGAEGIRGGAISGAHIRSLCTRSRLTAGQM